MSEQVQIDVNDLIAAKEEIIATAYRDLAICRSIEKALLRQIAELSAALADSLAKEKGK